MEVNLTLQRVQLPKFLGGAGVMGKSFGNLSPQVATINTKILL